MNNRSVIILSALLILFVITLSCALGFTQLTPSTKAVTRSYERAGYTCHFYDFGDYSMRTYKKDGNYVFIIWYRDGTKYAEKSIVTFNKIKGEKFVVRRGNAIAIGYEKDIRIFQFA